MSKKKKLFFIFAGLIIAIAILVYFFYRPEEEPVPLPSTKDNLILLNTSLPQGKVSAFNTTIGIVFQFNSPIKLSSANAIVLPYIPTAIELGRDNPSQLIIRPTERWETETEYEIIITKGLLSQEEDKELKDDINFIIEFERTPSDVIQMPPPGSRIQR